MKDHASAWLSTGLGSTRVAFNGTTGAVVAYFDYSPFGKTARSFESGTIVKYTYTGQEKDPETGLMNYKARMYDPNIGRFYAMDPAGQTPSFYNYCGNNPVNFTDPSGEFFIIDSWIVGFIDGFFKKGSNRFGNAWDEATNRSKNDAKIWGGLFTTDPNKSFGGRIWEFISRLTWQLPQTVGGFVTGQSMNTFGFKGFLGGGVESVDYKYGSTVVKTRDDNWGAFTQGSFIIGDNNIEADPNNSLFQHEYGHYIQSQDMGLAYYPRVGIPSILSNGEHSFNEVEQDANRRAFLYFNENVSGFYDVNQFDGKGWNFKRNPLDIYGNKDRYNYAIVDYKNPEHRRLLNNLRIHSKWYDYASWGIPVLGPVFVGLYNKHHYNK
ncbi:MAG: RHS repeat-associated core domain-containing protein [Bacteroidetes bacterium]|nr:RHS repeat-associated core domain-containing protein [Bacteroidota bacterium]